MAHYYARTDNEVELASLAMVEYRIGIVLHIDSHRMLFLIHKLIRKLFSVNIFDLREGIGQMLVCVLGFRNI